MLTHVAVMADVAAAVAAAVAVAATVICGTSQLPGELRGRWVGWGSGAVAHASAMRGVLAVPLFHLKSAWGHGGGAGSKRCR